MDFIICMRVNMMLVDKNLFAGRVICRTSDYQIFCLDCMPLTSILHLHLCYDDNSR